MDSQDSVEFREYWYAIAALIALNVVLSAAKISLGYIGDSSALRSDGWNNFADFIYTILLTAGIWISTAPPDQSHQEGHQRFESLVGLLVSFVIFGTGIYVIWDAVTTYFSREIIRVGTYGIIAVVISMIGKGLIAVFLGREGERLNSPAIKSIGMDQAGDILADLSVVVAVFSGYYGWPSVDSAVALVIGLIIVRIGWDPFIENLGQLTGRSPDGEVYDDIGRVIDHSEIFTGPTDIKAHHVGPGVHVSVTVKADANCKLQTIHEEEEKLLDNLLDLENVRRAFIHVEPYEVDSPN